MNRTRMTAPINQSQSSVGPMIYLPALSVKQPWASLIAQGKKTIETRVWMTDWRGPFVVAASKFPKVSGLPTGQALCIANLADCRIMRKTDERDAMCEIYPNAKAWLLDSVWPIVPFAVSGRQGFYQVAVGIEAILDEDRFSQIAELAHTAWTRMRSNPNHKWMVF